MQFQVQKKTNENIHKYPTDDMKLAHDFSLRLKEELGDFLVAVVVFGSAARRATTEGSDLDILIIGDDLAFRLTPELMQTYTIIVERLIAQFSVRLHVTSMTYTSFWEYVRIGDAVIINILRDGVALIDRGFFEPVQELLRQGRIKPSDESVWRYYGRAPRTLINSKWHLLQASVDLYWAVIDSAHAVLMRLGHMPPTPDHAADLLHSALVKKKKLHPKYVITFKRLFDLNKKIARREIKSITGAQFDKNLKDAQEFVMKMREFID